MLRQILPVPGTLDLKEVFIGIDFLVKVKMRNVCSAGDPQVPSAVPGLTGRLVDGAGPERLRPELLELSLNVVTLQCKRNARYSAAYRAC